MTALEAYQTYLAVKQHFADGSYDYFKYNGKVRVKESTFHVRPDKIFYEKLGRKYPIRDDLRDFIAFNMRMDPKIWVRGLCSLEAKTAYEIWKGFMESYSYHFSENMKRIHEKNEGVDFDSLFLVVDGEYPPILQMYLDTTLQLEILIGINLVTNCFAHWNNAIADPIIWPETYSLATKFAPFLNIDKVKLRTIMRKEFVK